MMHQGAIVEQGTHEELVKGAGSFALYKQQEASQ